MTLLLDLIYVPTIYCQFTSNSMEVIACARFLLQGRLLHNVVTVVSSTRHTYRSSSSPLSYIIKLSQTVWDLRSAQYFRFRGDNYITKKWELFFLHETRLLVLLFITTKYYQNMPKGIKVLEHTRCISDFHFRDGRKLHNEASELSPLHTTRLLVLLFIPINYNQIILYSMGVMVCTRIWLLGR